MSKKATFGGGCFWCTEAVFQNVKGVIKSVSGYMGGAVKNPTYEQVCSGNTGHAEVIEVEYDPAVISFNELLLIFFKTHNPTTLNRQGNDSGTQYRSVIFYADEEQKAEAEAMIKQLDAEGIFDQKIVTQVVPAETFYKAEGYHQNYFNNNSNQPYCAFVIQPKLNKFIKEFKEKTTLAY
ncbi:peptide-methionine (S)-S-oxide reductase MsrA [uncultured Mucilaginibacter sp.]|uniref:peptide-methionine (S)-S-oxide reductase MsrA n=1 Tax=uncultured Mucilaginibacter sp. TaxID=797541 RepID=UPI00262A623D|nr:peptide-methionine (S)-S-oxide reductase MsrA [uncultured Mucilaginibacter sp.]